MDAVNREKTKETSGEYGSLFQGAENRTYKIYFGGSYREHWSEDYTLFVE